MISVADPFSLLYQSACVDTIFYVAHGIPMSKFLHLVVRSVTGVET